MLIKKRNYTKAVAPVIGFMLLMAILFLAAAQYQGNVVPAQERSTEIDHYSEVTEDISGLRSSIIQTASTGQIHTQSINLGTGYDVLGLSQPAHPGTLTYMNTTSDISIRNAQNNKEASNFWRGDVEREYETGFLEYQINYNRIQSHADVYIEHGFMYRDTARGSDDEINMIEDSEQPIINGRSITIYTMQSSLDTTRIGSDTIETQPISAPMNSVSITNFEIGEPIRIELPTRLDIDDWERILCDETVEDYNAHDTDLNCTDEGGHINDIDVEEQETFNTVTIELKEDETYNLRMARVDLRSQSQRAATETTEEQYIAVERESANVREDSSIQLDAEVRDKFNNGVIGVPVTVEAQDTSQNCIGRFEGTSSVEPNCNNNNNNNLQPGYDISSADGTVRYEYTSPEIERDEDISFIYRMVN